MTNKELQDLKQDIVDRAVAALRALIATSDTTTLNTDCLQSKETTRTEPDLQDLPYVVLLALRASQGRFNYSTNRLIRFIKLNWPLLEAQHFNILLDIKEYLDDIKRGYYPKLPQYIIEDWNSLYDHLTKHSK